MTTASTSGRPAVTAEQFGGDKVVREIDVCLCNGVLGTDTKVGRLLLDEVGLYVADAVVCDVLRCLFQMYLLQYPLRPPWRPYDLDHCETVNLYLCPEYVLELVYLQKHNLHRHILCDEHIPITCTHVYWA